MAIAVLAHAVDPYRLVAPDRRSASAALAGSAAHGRPSVTLYEEIHPVKKLGNRRVQQRFLSSLQNQWGQTLILLP